MDDWKTITKEEARKDIEEIFDFLEEGQSVEVKKNGENYLYRINGLEVIASAKNRAITSIQERLEQVIKKRKKK